MRTTLRRLRTTSRLGHCGHCGRQVPVVQVWDTTTLHWVQERSDDDQVCPDPVCQEADGR